MPTNVGSQSALTEYQLNVCKPRLMAMPMGHVRHTHHAHAYPSCPSYSSCPSYPSCPSYIRYSSCPSYPSCPSCPTMYTPIMPIWVQFASTPAALVDQPSWPSPCFLPRSKLPSQLRQCHRRPCEHIGASLCPGVGSARSLDGPDPPDHHHYPGAGHDLPARS
jgi:hypothetical protein